MKLSDNYRMEGIEESVPFRYNVFVSVRARPVLGSIADCLPSS